MCDFPFRELRAGALAGLMAVLAACGGGGSTPGAGEVGTSDVAPTITSQPLDASVTAPATATFSAAATGTPVPTVQWQRSNDLGTTWAAVTGATAPSYTTPALAASDDSARFRAVFTNSAGSATSDAGRLTVTSIVPTPGLSLLAGDIGGPGNLDGTGSAARFAEPAGMASDASGNLYVADSNQRNIRKITPAGVVSIFAGSATGQVSGFVDGAGTAARFASPAGVATDAAGNVYVGDTGNFAIRKITPDGVVTTLAGGQYGTTDVDGVGRAAKFGLPIDVAVDSHFNVFVADANLHSIRRITPDGVVTTFAGVSSGVFLRTRVDGTGSAARFVSPLQLAIDAADNLYVGDSNVLRKVTPAAVVTTVPGTMDIADVRGLTVDPAGNVFVADRNSNVVRRIDTAGVATVFAGTVRAQFIPGYADGTGAAAVLYDPSGIAHDAAGNLFVADVGNNVIRKITPAAVVTTFVGAAALTGTSNGVGAAARFMVPTGIAVDGSGNLFVADSFGNTIRKVTSGGAVSTYAGTFDVYGSTDGNLATAQFRQPQAVAFDAAGDLYIAESGNLAIRKVTPDGMVSTLAGSGTQAHADGMGRAASFESVDSLAVDATGNVYVTESSAHVIRKITPAGVVTTFAGQVDVSGSADGTGTAATFNFPIGLTIDPSGNVIVTDAGNDTVRRITPAGGVTTLAGSAGTRGSADGTGAAASFSGVVSVTTDAAGNAYVVDGSLVRKVTPAGVVTTVLGTPGDFGVRLGADASLAYAGHLTWLRTGQLAITSANAVLLFTLP